MSDPNLSSFIWSVADLLRGDYKQSEYGKVILPFTVLRRLDCVLEKTKPAVLAELAKRTAAKVNPEPFLLRKSGQLFYNTSPLDLKKLMGDQDHIGENLRSYMQAFSPAVRDIFERFEFHLQIDRLAKANLLYLVTEKFANIDLHPDVVSNNQMGAVFEELIRKFAELSNETAGEHFTPRDAIRLMVNLLFIEDDDALTKPGVVRSIYDPTAGTGGMLSVAGEHLASQNPDARLVMYGQELNPESYAICKADMLIKGQDIANIVFGNTLSEDGLIGKTFDYGLSNPPFGVEWKKIEAYIRKEFEERGFDGRFGPGLPRVSDGSLLFLLHLISKMRLAKDGGSRFGIVLNGSPLFTGGAGSGESEIRRYVLENDLVEAIIGLPTEMFYNTPINTYLWIVTNRKPSSRANKVQLIDARGFWRKLKRNLGEKAVELSPEHIDDITKLFGDCKDVTRDGRPISRIFKNGEFGYHTITVERPKRDAKGNVMLETKGKRKGQPVPDMELRHTLNVPLSESVDEYLQREVLPHTEHVWIDHDKTKVGYEIPFNRHFYVFTPPRRLAEIDAELKSCTDKLVDLITQQNAFLHLLDEKQKAVTARVSRRGLDPAELTKDSGVSWLGVVPSHWEIRPSRTLFSLRNERARATDRQLTASQKHGVIYQTDFMELEGVRVVQVIKGAEILKHVEPNDFVISMRSFQGGIERCEVRGSISSAYVVLIPGELVHGPYFAYLLKSSMYIQALQTTTNLVRDGQALRYDNFTQVPLPLPPLDEQLQIAAFLETEISKIDAIISAVQQSVESLKDRRTALISAAVTGQIDVRNQ